MGDSTDPSKFLWNLTDHVCRACMGRVVRRRTADGGGLLRYYRCTNCGAETRARTVSSLCACGIKLNTGRDAGIRCVRNDNPRPECPSEIVAEVAEVPALPVEDDETEGETT